MIVAATRKSIVDDGGGAAAYERPSGTVMMLIPLGSTGTEAKEPEAPAPPAPPPASAPVKFANQLDFAKMLAALQPPPKPEPEPEPSKALIEVNVEELAEIQAILAERHKDHSVRS